MPVTSSYASFSIPDKSLWALLFERDDISTEAASTEIFQDAATGRSYNFASLREAAMVFSAGLRSIFHLQKADVVAIFSPNDIDYPVACLGILHAEGVFLTMSSTLTAAELAFQLRDSKAKVLVTHPTTLGLARKAARKAGLPESNVLQLGHEASNNSGHFLSLGGASEQQSPISTTTKNDLAALTYSSGTTGLPKGVELTHENLIAVIMANAVDDAEPPPGNGDNENFKSRTLAVLPFSHIYGVVFLLLQPIYELRTAIVMRSFTLEAFCSTIEKYRITYGFVVPPILVLLAKSPVVSKYDLSSVRGFMSAAAPLQAELIEGVWERLKIPIKQAYGLSETSPTITIQPWSRWTMKGSVGILAPNMTLKWSSSDGNEVELGREGEIWVKGPNVFRGYLGKARMSEEAFSDGWFRTGDIGYQDEDGNCYITDRLKELIKYKGFQVAPAELEGKLLSHPKIADVAVLGVYVDEEASEVPRAFVVPAAGVTADAACASEILSWINSQVSHHKKIRGGIQWIDAVPKSPTGKILRRVLRKKSGVSSQPSKSKL